MAARRPRRSRWGQCTGRSPGRNAVSPRTRKNPAGHSIPALPRALTSRRLCRISRAGSRDPPLRRPCHRSDSDPAPSSDLRSSFMGGHRGCAVRLRHQLDDRSDVDRPLRPPSGEPLTPQRRSGSDHGGITPGGSKSPCENHEQAAAIVTRRSSRTRRRHARCRPAP